MYCVALYNCSVCSIFRPSHVRLGYIHCASSITLVLSRKLQAFVRIDRSHLQNLSVGESYYSDDSSSPEAVVRSLARSSFQHSNRKNNDHPQRDAHGSSKRRPQDQKDEEIDAAESPPLLRAMAVFTSALWVDCVVLFTTHTQLYYLTLEGEVALICSLDKAGAKLVTVINDRAYFAVTEVLEE